MTLMPFLSAMPARDLPAFLNQRIGAGFGGFERSTKRLKLIYHFTAPISKQSHNDYVLIVADFW
jgi:hypothetical protein